MTRLWTRVVLTAVLLCSVPALAAKKKKAAKTPPPPAAPTGPAWTAWTPACRVLVDGSRAFVAVGRSGDAGTPDARDTQAEDDARQHLGEAIATWQEKVLRCAQKTSEAKVTASSAATLGVLSFNLQSASEVSLYGEKLEARLVEGTKVTVLMRHDVKAMIAGIAADSARSASLKEAAAGPCGDQAFDALVQK